MLERNHSERRNHSGLCFSAHHMLNLVCIDGSNTIQTSSEKHRMSSICIVNILTQTRGTLPQTHRNCKPWSPPVHWAAMVKFSRPVKFKAISKALKTNPPPVTTTIYAGSITEPPLRYQTEKPYRTRGIRRKCPLSVPVLPHGWNFVH